MQPLQRLIQGIRHLESEITFGRISSVQGLMAQVVGLNHKLSLGSRCLIHTRQGQTILAEVVGFQNKQAVIMSFGDLVGVGLGCRVDFIDHPPVFYPSLSWIGRILDAHACPIDDGPPLPHGSVAYRIINKPPPAHKRQPVGQRMDLGVRAINTFVTCCQGQRMGIFAGSGVGKSVLLSMMTRHSDCDVIVIGLIGERGREVQEFIQQHLGPEGLARSILVVATSDEPPLMRKQAAHLTLMLAEYFRDQGQNVLCLMDSVTRFAMALREIGLSAGEPPATRGYTPIVFAELPRLLERAGPGVKGQGHITGLFTVLVEGDDPNEPVADAVRGILDGHIVLDRLIAERGRYPPVNVLKSVSRTMPDCQTEEEQHLVQQAKELMSLYDTMAELIRIGAYRPGSDPAMDRAIKIHPLFEAFLKQGKKDITNIRQGFQQLAVILRDHP